MAVPSRWVEVRVDALGSLVGCSPHDLRLEWKENVRVLQGMAEEPASVTVHSLAGEILLQSVKVLSVEELAEESAQAPAGEEVSHGLWGRSLDLKASRFERAHHGGGARPGSLVTARGLAECGW